MKSVEVQLHEALGQIKALTAENTSLKQAVTAAKIALAKAERDGVLKESRLPEPCLKRIEAAFSKSTSNAGLKEAINVELRHIERALR